MKDNNSIIIYGNGAMAHVLYSYIKDCYSVCGFVVDDNCIKKDEDTFCGLPLIAYSKFETVFPPETHKIIIAVGYLEMNELRFRKYNEIKKKGYQFISYVHNSVHIHDGVQIEENCIVLDFVSIHPETKIGHSTFISSNVNIGHTCKIEHSNWINSGVSIAGGCTIGAQCFWGVNSCAGHGIQIGESNFIGANTLINKNTDKNQVYISESGQLHRLDSINFLRFFKL